MVEMPAIEPSIRGVIADTDGMSEIPSDRLEFDDRGRDCVPQATRLWKKYDIKTAYPTESLRSVTRLMAEANTPISAR